ncbi:flagellar hook protein FlgE [Blastochloris viridis]|uniref:Flagellar hook protein FlgE n=1 Tax=Blastochloris viridis TaxID=1079 RepID=A0A0H5B8W7_BLAVI|nr:flagellar hook protein FlgE [Blastochloris viridis]ALK08085.1 Flagellar hook protein FlgE [Blastochloris viridis]BAR98655.1 flagellar hook protein FlgE [Blastochloris viridis]CUU44007.1 Flagellar hook protein flgE [Blastochloris viridis]
MSLSGALNSSVSALKAQSTAIATVSDNLANSSTYGYKTTVASFESLVTGSSSSSYSSGGVLSNTRSNISAQGQLASTSSDTDLAIQGNGFFVVSPENSTNRYYTRNGEFSTDEDGYLVNNGYQLLGWPTDTSGNVIGSATSGTLQAIYTNIKPSCAQATTTATISANLPSNAAAGVVGSMDVEVYDSQGNAHNVTLSWTKDAADNTWTATPTATGATISPATFTIEFDANGAIVSTDATQSLNIDWGNGTSTSDIAFNLSGLSQQSVEGATIDLKTINQNGLSYGSLTGITVEDGMVNASYSNGASIPIYQIAVATFTNANGLTAESGGLYRESSSSGTSTLHVSGEGGAGTVYGSTLESSKTDTSEEFSVMITAQQAYSSSAQVISTVSSMYDTLISALR